MNDVNDTMSSKNAEFASEIFTISSLAEMGYKAAFVDYDDSKVSVEVLGALFLVMKDRLDALESAILQQPNVGDTSIPDTQPVMGIPISKQNQTLINREFENNVIRQRGDGYIDATAMCKATGKRWNDYFRLESTQAFISELSTKTGYPAMAENQSLIQSLKGGNDLSITGTWVHPRVAIHLAQWCSPEFAVQVTDWVFELMTTGEVHLQSKPQLSKIHDLFPRTDAPIQSYIDECLERREAGEEIPQLNSRELIRKAITEGCHTRREIADYTGIKRATVKTLIQRMLKAGEVHCTMVKTQSRVFLN